MKKRTIVFLAACTIVLGYGIGGTLAWLTDVTKEAENTFTVGNISIELTETFNKDSDNDSTNDTWEKKMIPGWTLSKDPKVKVNADSEDCWLFIKIEESANLDDYIAYAIADGWEPLKDNGNPENIIDGVYCRKIDESSEKGSDLIVLGKGSFTDTKGTDDSGDDVTYSWANDNEVLVKQTVTKAMMDAIDGVDDLGSTTSDAAKAEIADRPTLTFTAYAVQLWEKNNPGQNAAPAEIEAAQFDAYTAWTQIPQQ